MKTPTLETDRLILREIYPNDTQAIFNGWMNDENVSRYMWWNASNDINDAKEFVEFELGNLENGKWNRWIIVLKSIPVIIGTCLIFFNEDEGHWDISYNLGKKFLGQRIRHRSHENRNEICRRRNEHNRNQYGICCGKSGFRPCPSKIGISVYTRSFLRM